MEMGALIMAWNMIMTPVGENNCYLNQSNNLSQMTWPLTGLGISKYPVFPSKQDIRQSLETQL